MFSDPGLRAFSGDWHEFYGLFVFSGDTSCLAKMSGEIKRKAMETMKITLQPRSRLVLGKGFFFIGFCLYGMTRLTVTLQLLYRMVFFCAFMVDFCHEERKY